MLTSDDVPAARRLIALDGVDLILGNSVAVLPHLRGRYQAIVSDPPYGIKYDPSGPPGSNWKDVKGIVGDDGPFDPCPMLAWAVPTVLFGANNFARSATPGPEMSGGRKATTNIGTQPRSRSR